ncbi:unnamed protein product [Caenorhabditis brenneri]
MPHTVPLIGRELCFWCVESFQKCPVHSNPNVFWNDVTVRSYSGESDGFRVVEEKDLKNLERNAYYTESGKFVHPPNGSSLPISSTFNFPKIPEKPQIVVKNEVLVGRKSKVEIIKKPKLFKVPKLPKNKGPIKIKKLTHTKIHQNALKSEAAEYNGGRACDKSRKVFLCDFCEFSFTLHHNLQKHLIRFHGDSENISSEKLSLLKETFDRMDKLGREESKKELVS